MSDYVHWLIELKLESGKLEAFKALAKEAVASTRKEPGTIGYDWNISDDGETIHIYECFKDSAAVMAHLTGFTKFRDTFYTMVKPVSFTVYGSPNDEVRTALAGRARFFNPVEGFVR